MEERLAKYSTDKIIWQMAGPNILIACGMLLYNIVDTFFVSCLQGDLPLASVGITFPITVFTTALSSLLTVGINTVVSKCLGEKNYHKGEEAVSGVLLMSIILGVILGITMLLLNDPLLRLLGATSATFEYADEYAFWLYMDCIFYFPGSIFNMVIKAQGFNKLALRGYIGSIIVNIILDYLFIIVFKWGVAGASLATFCATLVLMAENAYFLYSHKEIKIKAYFSKIKITWQLISDIYKSGISGTVGQLVISALVIVYNSITKSLPNFTMIQAAFAIALKFLTVEQVIFQGYAQSLLTMESYALGAKRKNIFLESLCAGRKASVYFNIIFLVFFLIAGRWCIGIFTNNPYIINIGFWILICRTVLSGANNWSVALISAYRAFLDASNSISLSVVRQGLILIVFLWIGTKLFGIYGFLGANVATDLILILINVYYARYLDKRVDEYFV